MPPDPFPNDSSSLRVYLLGGFRIWTGGERVPERGWRLRKARTLVKLLALAPGHRLHREAAMAVLWPDHGPWAAANNLKQALYVARRTLRPDTGPGSRVLHLQRDLLTLNPQGTLWIDVEAFEAAAAAARRMQNPAAYRAAVDLYGGDLLPEDRFEDWAALPRESLRRTYLELLETLAGLYEAQGENAAAIDAWQQVVASEPANEEAHAHLMRLFARSGRRHLALRQYQQLRQVLQREFGAVPEAATERLREDICAGRFPGT